MTGYHIEIGYNGTASIGVEAMWPLLRQTAVALCSAPEEIVEEVRRMDELPTCPDGCSLETHTAVYARPLDDEIGHPVMILEEQQQVMQLSSGGCVVKQAVRRAFVRLLIKRMHQQGIEISVVVA